MDPKNIPLFRKSQNARISAVALIKMLMHARSGGNLEIMGLMQGKIVKQKKSPSRQSAGKSPGAAQSASSGALEKATSVGREEEPCFVDVQRRNFMPVFSRASKTFLTPLENHPLTTFARNAQRSVFPPS